MPAQYLLNLIKLPPGSSNSMIFARWFLSMSEWSREELELCVRFLQTLFKLPKRSCLKYLALFFFLFFQKGKWGVAYWKTTHLQGLTRFKSKRQGKGNKERCSCGALESRCSLGPRHTDGSHHVLIWKSYLQNTQSNQIWRLKGIHWRISWIAGAIWIWWQRQRVEKNTECHSLSLEILFVC